MTKAINREQVWNDFREAVNMTPASLEKWLKTDESRENGWTVSYTHLTLPTIYSV